MAKKPEYKPFPGVNCQRMRNLKDMIKRLKDERTQMFSSRDNAVESLHNCGEAETQKQLKLKGDWADACMAIERLKKQIKWCQDEMLRTIESADQADLFDDPGISLPSFEDEDPEPDEGDTRPVGEPGGGDKSDTIDAYLPGRFKDQNGNEKNYADMDAIRAKADSIEPGLDLHPMVSETWGASIEFRKGTTVMGKLTWVGKPKGRKAG